VHGLEIHDPRLEPPDLRLGWSVYVYEVDARRLARLRSERGRVTPFYSSAAAYESLEGGQPQLEDELDSSSGPETGAEPDTTESDEPPPAR
jgi:DNA-binding IclR family transcriptional regulator